MNDDDNHSVQNDLIMFQTNGTWDCVECLSNSFQRVQVLAALTDAPVDLRDLKDELNIPRTTLQRNLTQLEQHGWIKQTPPGYTTTIRGRFLTNVFIEMLERIQRIEILTPFLDAIDLPTAIDIDRLDEFRVTVPEPRRPHAPMIRLLDIFETADYMRALSPVAVGLLAKRYSRPSELTGEYELILSKTAVDTHRRPEIDEWRDGIETEQSSRIDIRIYDGAFPYGLFVCEGRLALAAYNGDGRIQALVESASEEAIEWGEGVYETYSHQSQLPRGTDIP